VTTRDFNFNEETRVKVPVKLLWSVGALITGVVIWMTTFYVQQVNAIATIEEVRTHVEVIEKDRIQRREEVMEKLSDLKSDMNLVKEKLGIRE
jgi:hypothetical protein